MLRELSSNGQSSSCWVAMAWPPSIAFGSVRLRLSRCTPEGGWLRQGSMRVARIIVSVGKENLPVLVRERGEWFVVGWPLGLLPGDVEDAFAGVGGLTGRL